MEEQIKKLWKEYPENKPFGAGWCATTNGRDIIEFAQVTVNT